MLYAREGIVEPDGRLQHVVSQRVLSCFLTTLRTKHVLVYTDAA